MIVFCLAVAMIVAEEKPLPLRNGERVVLVGDALIERDQRYSYFESGLLARYWASRITFRNLGWSGDTIDGTARTYGESAESGRQRLIDQIRQAEPTLLIVGYGMSGSFDAPSQEEYSKRFARLLDDAAKDCRKILLLTPIRHEALGPPLPDPTPHNLALATIASAFESVASNRRARIVDLFEKFTPNTAIAPHLTDNGIHLHELGYWQLALRLERELGLPPLPIEIELDAKGTVGATVGAEVSDIAATPEQLTFNALEVRLPTDIPAGADQCAQADEQATTPKLRVNGLAAGQYALRIDDVPVARGSAEEWKEGILLVNTPQHRIAAELRQEVIRKNALYFQRFRPQNFTYLLGFRRYEQGQNAAELDTLQEEIERVEARIDQLRIPRRHRYQLTRIKE